MEIVGSLSGDVPPIKSDKAVRNAWQAYTALADKYNEPGRFTAIIGFEWTAIGGYNLHRNVMFRGNASVANRTLPFSQFDSKNPEDLWNYLAEFEKRDRVGGAGDSAQRQSQQRPDVHGRDLRRQAADQGTGRDAQHGSSRSMEVTQIKGDGEAHPLLSPNDEFAGYEIWDKSNLNGTEAKKPEMLQWEYAREALKNGLMLEQQARRQPVQVRHGRQHGLPHLAVDGRGGQLLRQALGRGARAASLGTRRHRRARSEIRRSRAGSRRPAAMRPSGRRRTRAKRSSTR